MLFKKGVSWTAVCGGGLVMLAAAPLFPAPYAVLSISTSLGKTLYLVALIVLVVGGVIAASRESANEAAKHDTTQAMIKSLMESFDQRDALTGGSVFSDGVTETLAAADTQTAAGAVALPTPSISGEGSVTITPGTGRLEIEGFAPTISVKALDQEIREKRAALLRYLQEDDASSFFAKIGAALRKQDVDISGNAELPTAENKKRSSSAPNLSSRDPSFSALP